MRRRARTATVTAFSAVVVAVLAGGSWVAVSRTTPQGAGLERMRIRGPVGEPVTIAEARRRAPYGVPVPSYTSGLGEPRGAVILTAGSKVQVALKWADGSFLAFVPRPTERDYGNAVRLTGSGTVVQLGSGHAYAKPPSNSEGVRTPGILRWWRQGVEYTLHTDRSISEMRRIAGSLDV